MRAPSDSEHALISVGRWLAELDYDFTAITPESHRRVVARRSVASTIRDVFGWSLPFERALLPAQIVESLRAGDALEEAGDRLKSRIRFSSLRGRLYVHSAYPTDHRHAVFFGPDTYRFCEALATTVTHARRVVDLGAGSGAGGISLAERCDLITLADCNPLAETYARVNAHLAGCSDRVELVVGDLFERVTGPVELVIANPPYIADPAARLYCDGGEQLGTAMSLRIVEESLARLEPGGKLVLYTGSPIQNGIDPIRTAVTPMLARMRWSYSELDPDVFGEELSSETYANVERIAAVLLTVET